MRSAMLGAAFVLACVVSLTRGADPAHAPAHADDSAATAHADSAAAAAHPSYTHPVVRSDPAPWAGATVIMIIGLFLAAAVIGPIVRYHAPEAPPEPSAHADDHADHDHGHDGHAAHGH